MRIVFTTFAGVITRFPLPMMLLSIALYLVLLLAYSRFAGRSRQDNTAFYRARGQSAWPMVAFGMIGASISGVTFVSVPGMVLSSQMTYLAMCLGFVAGYAAVAFVLLPVYYRTGTTTIYGYLQRRLGQRAYLTGGSFFLLSKLTGAAARLYIAIALLYRFTPALHAVPFAAVCAAVMAVIWLYTRRGGITTLVRTDMLQTFFMLTALVLIIYNVGSELGLSVPEMAEAVNQDPRSRVFILDDWQSPHHFLKLFVSGAFVVIAMTGLDQDMMQKNLTCRSLGDAQKNMCLYGTAFVPVNLLFLALGVLVAQLAQRQGTPLPSVNDDLLPMFAATGRLGVAAQMLFTVGITAAALSSADSALTALTTSFCIDIRKAPDDEQLRKRTHIGMACLLTCMMLLFDVCGSKSMIDTIYTLCGYTYGPLLGLFAFGLCTRKQINDRYVPYIAVASPIVCYAIDRLAYTAFGYRFGYEMLLINGLITFVSIALLPKQPCTRSPQPQ